MYLEGSSDLAILQAFAKVLDHPAQAYLEQPFVQYVANDLGKARSHFFGLLEAWPRLRGIAILDRHERRIQEGTRLVELSWLRKEIENYLCMPEVLLAYAKGEDTQALLEYSESSRRVEQIEASIAAITNAIRVLGDPDPWSPDVKASDQFLDRLFKHYFEGLGLPNLMNKSQYHELARLVPRDKLNPEVSEKLDAIVTVAREAEAGR